MRRFKILITSKIPASASCFADYHWRHRRRRWCWHAYTSQTCFLLQFGVKGIISRCFLRLYAGPVKIRIIKEKTARPVSCPSLISLVVSVDVKHYVYLLDQFHKINLWLKVSTATLLCPPGAVTKRVRASVGTGLWLDLGQSVLAVLGFPSWSWTFSD